LVYQWMGVSAIADYGTDAIQVAIAGDKCASIQIVVMQPIQDDSVYALHR
jgi:hypothetical protein